jgi:hypothetical protein
VLLCDGGPIAIVGTGIAGVAAIINKLVDIADNAKINAPPVNVMVFDTGGPKPRADLPYPLAHRLPRLLHPFYTEKPPTGFPTFGEYVDKLFSETPRLKDALLRPTYDQINDYMRHMLELAVRNAGASVLMKFTATAIVEIRETITGGPAVIVLADGSRMHVSKVVRARSPRYMGGPGLSDQGASAAQRKDVPAEPRLRLTLELIRGAADIALGKTGLLHDMDKKSHFLVLLGTRRIAVIALDLPELALGPRVQLVLQGLGRVGATELWVVTPESVGEEVQSRLDGKPVRFLSLFQFLSLIEKLSVVGPAFDE